jgi:hypothetical protein
MPQALPIFAALSETPFLLFSPQNLLTPGISDETLPLKKLLLLSQPE